MLLSCILLSSCSKDSDPKIIEEELRVYFDAFVYEAAEYGKEIDLASIDIGAYVEDIQTAGTIGQCIKYSDGSKEIVIDERNWDRLDEFEKEYVVFHELGHCLLLRSHNNDVDENGFCESIMQSGEGFCVNHYKASNRSKLLQELFTN